MKKAITRDSVLDYLRPRQNEYNVRFGIFGSVARGTNGSKSDIDIIYSCPNSVAAVTDVYDLLDLIKKDFGVSCDIVRLEDVKRESEELVSSLIGLLGDMVIGSTFYDEIKEEVVWCD